MAMVVRAESGTCAAVCQSVSNTASNTAKWMGKTIHSFCSAVANLARNVITFAEPYLKNLTEAVKANKGPIAVAVVAACVGAFLYAGINALFCSKTNNPVPVPPPAGGGAG